MAGTYLKTNKGAQWDGIVFAPATSRWLALGAVAGQVLFTLAWFILGFISPGFTMFGTVIEPYSAIATPLSGLGLGLTGPVMNAAFIISGLLVLAGVLGIFQSIPEFSARARWILTALFALSPIGMIIDGIFTIEQIMPHTIGFLLGSGTPVISFLIAGILLRRIPRWKRLGFWLTIGSPLTLILFILFFATFDQTAVMAGTGVAGLTERIQCLELAIFFIALGWSAYRNS